MSNIDLDSIIQLSKDPNTAGFDLVAGKTWIYPTNYPIREYQLNITQAALHQNTLVSLPTGLGKTFIAAVVMYNYYRWYPMGKIIFMAPTKPLVTQQMDACYNIMAIPRNVTVEMTGSKVNTSRAKLWKEKRVFFITPHILQNDIDSVLELAPQIRCIVIDEAHKALGKNANCEAIKKIEKINPNFRVLALSATPGSNFNSIKDVISNLLISHIEMRTNESVDVAPYVFERKLETFVIPITGKLLAVKMEYVKILDKFTRPLLQYNIFTGNCANLTKGRIVLTMKEFKERGRHHNQYGYILKTLNICVTIYHGYELLIRHGLRAFLIFFKENISKPLVNSIREIHGFIEDVENYLGPIDNVEMLPDGTIPEITGPIIYSHPKFQKLSEVIKHHFSEVNGADTRVMVFCEFRESVREIYSLLLRHRPLIKPRIFLGQASISQAQQLQAVKMFKSGQCNTLVSTCIGEEGLDVGEVDLIVCFDISSKSPIRMVQRMGRTGRKRDGRVVVLVTEGKEQQLLSESLVQRTSMNSLLESTQIKAHLYKNNPKMIPENIKPECNQLYITVKEPEKLSKKKNESKTTKKNNNNTLKSLFDNMSSSQSSTRSGNDRTTTISNLSKKRKPIKKQTDIRSIFSKLNNSQTQLNNSTEVIDIDEYEKTEGPNELKDLIKTMRSYLNVTMPPIGCLICEKLFYCKGEYVRTKQTIEEEEEEINWEKSKKLSDKITAKSLKLFSENLEPFSPDTLQFFQLNSSFDIFSDDDLESNKICYENNDINYSVDIFDSSMGFETQNNHEPAQLLESQKQNINCETPNKIKKIESPNQIIDDDLLIVSDTDKELSPVLKKSRKLNKSKSDIHRKLFSQSTSTPNNSIINKSVEQLGIKTNCININSEVTTTKNMNSNMNSPNKSILPQNIDFWDESIFEICDSDDEMGTEEPQIKETENSLNLNNLNKENTEVNEKFNESKDSDDTIILSFNTETISKDLEIEKKKLEQQNNKVLFPPAVPEIDKSLLSVTQLIDYLNDTPNKNETKNMKSPVRNNMKSPVRNDTIYDDANEILDQLFDDNKPSSHTSQTNKINTEEIVENLLKDVSFVESDEDFSLLDFSQKNATSSQLKKQNITNPINSVKSTNHNIDKPVKSNNLLNIIIIDSDEEPVSSSTQQIKTKSQPHDNEINATHVLKDINLNTKDENCIVISPEIGPKNPSKRRKLLFSLKTTTEPTNTSSNNCNIPSNKLVSLTQGSPIKINKNSGTSKKRVIFSDSDDDFEIKPKRKEPSISKLTPEKTFKRIKSISEEVKTNSKPFVPNISPKSILQSYPKAKTKSTGAATFKKSLAYEVKHHPTM